MILFSHRPHDSWLIVLVSKLSFMICQREYMRILYTFILLSLLATAQPALADEDGEEADNLSILLQARRDGTVLPLFAILRSIYSITGGSVVEIEFENHDGLMKYGIYYLTPEGRRREVYVDARTGAVLEDKAAK